MKKIKTVFFTLFFFAIFLPHSALSAVNNQLITQLIVTDTDSTYRYLYLYDTNGNKVVETKSIQKNNSWIRNSQTEWFYQGNKCVLQREKRWNNNKWDTSYDIDYQYVNGNLTTELHQSYTNETASWVKKIDLSYTSSILTLKKEYKRTGSQWILTMQTNFTYTFAGNSDSVSTTVFDLGAIKDQFLIINKYNVNGTIENQVTKKKNTAEVWVNSELVNYYYQTGSTNLESQRNKKWNFDISDWENTQRIDNRYDNTNRMISETYQRWKLMFWENDIRYDYVYENNNLVKKALSLPIYHKWRSIISIHYSDFAGNKANLIESQFDFWGGNSGDFATSFIPYVFNNEPEIQKGNRVKISYLPIIDTTTTTTINELLNLKREFPVYPNPSTGVYYLNTQEFKIISWIVMDLNGRVLKRQNNLVQSGIIDITDLTRGIYMLSVNCDDQNIIQKLIKE